MGENEVVVVAHHLVVVAVEVDVVAVAIASWLRVFP
jgi:hypothetical protein